MKLQAITPLATGGMAEISSAILEPGGRRVVVKHLLPRLAGNPRVAAQLIAEGERMRCLANEPGVADIIAILPEGDSQFVGPCLVLEHVAGIELAQLIARGPLPERVAATVALRLAEILDSVHRASAPDGALLELVHRDLCPENVLVERGGRLVLLDFGVSSAIWPAVELSADQGRAAYMAPEQATGRDVDGRADLYSLGVMLFEMVTGERYYGTTSRLAILGKLMDGYCAAPSDFGFAGSSQLEAIIIRALTPDPDDRFPNAGALASELGGWLAAHGGPASLAGDAD